MLDPQRGHRNRQGQELPEQDHQGLRVHADRKTENKRDDPRQDEGRTRKQLMR